jgi:8-oxo-dGTP pyrophosphatase MutT (NUDIX family)
VIYRNLHFEHSDTCPSRRNREIAEKVGQEPKISKKTLKMATCAYIMDRDDNILITRRPSSLRIFPYAWVLPGGIVDPGELFEDACLREVHEEIGLKAIKVDNTRVTFQTQKKDSLLGGTLDADFIPYYLYESVTKNLKDIDDHQSEKFPPKS